MKKLMTLFLLITMFFTCSCSTVPKESESQKINITCTAFPQYDWVRELTNGSDKFNITLLGGGVDLHNFQPSVKDIINLKASDAVIYTGGESDSWASDALNESSAHGINMLELIGDAAREEEHFDSAEHSEARDERELDEHVWLSLKNAMTICGAISDTLIEIAPQENDLIKKNTTIYLEKLKNLHEEYTGALSGTKYDTLVFADRFPFRYMLEDYDIKYFAAFPGCSAESEASFETITFLSKKLDELNLPVVMTTDGGTGDIAKTILKNSSFPDREILSLFSMQAISEQETDANYLLTMEENLKILKKALN